MKLKWFILEILLLAIICILKANGYVSEILVSVLVIWVVISAILHLRYTPGRFSSVSSEFNNVRKFRSGFANYYAIRAHEGNIIVDTGNKSDRSRVYKKLKDRKDIKLIILTHNHKDHIANAKYLSEKFRVPIAMSEEDYYDLEHHSYREMSAHTLFGKLLLKLSKNPTEIDSEDKFVPDIFLKDGDSLIKYGVNAQIISLKGHTRGSVGILVENNELIVGDAMENLLFPSPASIYYDKDMMLESVDKIKASGVGNVMVYPGHGMPFVVK